MATPLSNDSPFASPRLIEEKKTYDPVAIQIDLLKESFKDKSLPSKEMQANCQNTVTLCFHLGAHDKVVDLIGSAEQENVYNDNPEGKANLYASAIKALIGKELHAQADDVFKSAVAKGVWKDFSAQRNSAIEALKNVGFNY